MTYFALSLKPAVIRASPGGHPPSLRHAASSSGPAASWIAPSTPPPPNNAELAALTMGSALSAVMAPRIACSRSAMSFRLRDEPAIVAPFELDELAVDDDSATAVSNLGAVPPVDGFAVLVEYVIREDLRR